MLTPQQESTGRIKPLPDPVQPYRTLPLGVLSGGQRASIPACPVIPGVRSILRSLNNPRDPSAPDLRATRLPADPRSPASLPAHRAPSVCAAHARTGGLVGGGPSETALFSPLPLICARIRSISTGSSMLAITLTAEPQRTQLSTSMPKTRFSRCAQLIATCRSIVTSRAEQPPSSPCPFRPASPPHASGGSVRVHRGIA